MSLASPHISANHLKTGTCPHGLPLGACPICNGMAGGNSTSKRDTPRNVGEMTYNQCAAIGAILKAQRQAREQAKIAQQEHQSALLEFAKNIAKTHQKLMEFTQIISNTFPKIIAKPINFVLNTIVGNVLRVVHNISVTISNIAQNISQKFADISDKLAAVFGELKASINEKISKFLSDTKKKLKSLFFVFGGNEADDEEKKIDEAKRTFDIKTFIHNLCKKLKGDTEKESLEDEH